MTFIFDLRIYKSNKNQYENIPIQNIIEIKQLPIKNNSMTSSNTAVYTLTGRLARAYTLKENEILSSTNSDGSVVITCKNEPQDDLIKRLIRYDVNCIINSPESLKEKMLNTIQTILKNYE